MKKVVFILTILISISSYSQIGLDTLNYGAYSKDPTAEPLRSAMIKIDNNFRALDSINKLVADSIISALANVDDIKFNMVTARDWLAGQLYFNSAEHTIELHTEKDGVILQIGQEFYIWMRNSSGTPIDNGTYVRFSGVTGEVPDFDVAGCGSMDSALVIGATTHDFAINEFGFITKQGKINGVDRVGYTPGSLEYLGHAGKATIITPTFPDIATIVGTTLRANANGISYVQIERVPWNIPSKSIYFSGVNRQRAGDTTFIYDYENKKLEVNSAHIPEYLTYKSYCMKWHRVADINTTQANTWINVKYDYRVDEESTTEIVPNADTTGFIINVNGIYEFAGCMHAFWSGGIAATSSYSRVLLNSDVSRCSQRTSSKSFQGNAYNDWGYSGTLSVMDAPDTVYIQYRVASTSMDFMMDDAVFGAEEGISQSFWIKRISNNNE